MTIMKLKVTSSGWDLAPSAIEDRLTALSITLSSLEKLKLTGITLRTVINSKIKEW